MPELQDPIAVINSLQSRIGQLERQLQMERIAAQEKYPLMVSESVRRLRLHGIIALNVRATNFDKLREEVRKSSPCLIDSIEEVWHLQNAPVPEEVKAALFAAANGGMDRW